MNNEILKEQYFPHLFLSVEERDFILDLIVNCKDISDSETGFSRKGNLVQLSMKKEDDLIEYNGLLSYKTENRCISGYVIMNKKKIYLYNHIERLCVKDKNKEYDTCDIFIKSNEGYNIESTYSFNNKIYRRKINEEKKVKLWEK